MKRYNRSRHGRTINYEREIQQKRHDEQKSGGFKCSHCKQWVVINPFIGTSNRNHCNLCLWSRHVDNKKGDRKSECHGGMRPIALTFKHEGNNKQGEIMLVHLCAVCDKVSINRIAGDDIEDHILAVFAESLELDPALKQRLLDEDIYQLSAADRRIIHIQLFGDI